MQGIWSTKRLWKILLLSVILLFCFTPPSHALDVTLAWSANTEPDIVGYKVFMRMEGQSYNYGAPAWEGSDTQHHFTNLNDNAKYFFVVRATDNYAASGNSQEIFVIGPNHPDLDPQYDRGWGITTGDLKGFMLHYHSNDPAPTFSPSSESPVLNITGVNGVGIPLHFAGGTFNTPVKLFIPCSGYSNVNDVDLYYYDDVRMDWYLANDADYPDTVQPDAVGWLVEGSRYDHNFSDDPANDPSTIEIQVYHFSGVQAGTPTGGSASSSSSSGGGGGGCFIATAAFGSDMD